jgi:hypothetical protein
VFYTVQEARVLVEAWQLHYNQVRPHSVGYRPPAPEAVARHSVPNEEPERSVTQTTETTT